MIGVEGRWTYGADAVRYTPLPGPTKPHGEIPSNWDGAGGTYGVPYQLQGTIALDPLQNLPKSSVERGSTPIYKLQMWSDSRSTTLLYPFPAPSNFLLPCVGSFKEPSPHSSAMLPSGTTDNVSGTGQSDGNLGDRESAKLTKRARYVLRAW